MLKKTFFLGGGFGGHQGGGGGGYPIGGNAIGGHQGGGGGYPVGGGKYFNFSVLEHFLVCELQVKIEEDFPSSPNFNSTNN